MASWIFERISLYSSKGDLDFLSLARHSIYSSGNRIYRRMRMSAGEAIRRMKNVRSTSITGVFHGVL
jgi:hypothetical protein